MSLFNKMLHTIYKYKQTEEKHYKQTILVVGHDLKFIEGIIEKLQGDNYEVLIDHWEGHDKHSTYGILADGEDAYGLAEGIAKLYENPELFQKMSEAAPKRVREQSGFEQTIGKELALFNQTNKMTVTQSSLKKTRTKTKI